MTGDTWALIIVGGVVGLFLLEWLGKASAIAFVYFVGAALSTVIAGYGVVQAARFEHTDWTIPAAFGAMAAVQWAMFRSEVRRPKRRKARR